MKNLIITGLAMALASFAFFSCDSIGKKKFDFEARLEAKQKAEETGTVIDTVLLDFRFGMTEKEVNLHSKDLIKEGRLNKDYTYTLKGEFDSYDCTIHPKYHDGKLYTLTLALKPSGSSELAALEMVRIVTEKYAVASLKEPKLAVTDCERYYFYIGNLTIEIMCSIYGDVYLIYSDNRISDEVNMMNDSIKIEQKSKTLQDF